MPGEIVGEPNLSKKEDNDVAFTPWGSDSCASAGLFPVRQTIGPILLMTICPFFSTMLCSILRDHDGNMSNFYAAIKEQGIFIVVSQFYFSPFNAIAWKIIAVFLATALFLTHVLPGEICTSPVSASGYCNKYKANGIPYWFSFIALFIIGSQYGLGFYEASIIYDSFGHIISALNVSAFFLCFFLYVKGHLFPSSPDCTFTGSFIKDFYGGTELYPNVLGWDIKLVTNCRFGLQFWGIALLSFVSKQYETDGHLSDALMVSVILQLLYLTKFFVWEAGYFCSVDMQHDHAGFYICWGCLVWVPSVYTLAAHWLVSHPIGLSSEVKWLLIVFGSFCIWLNYAIDAQRELFRKSKGKMRLWGKPAASIVAVYRDGTGKVHESLLLVSGFWGIATHFHYIPEVLAAVCWTPAVQMDNILPYFYVIFLIFLLLDRAHRDDERCAQKYGKYWQVYRRVVPWKVIPYVF